MKIAVASGDGIGKEIVEEALKVLKKVETVFSINFEYEKVLIGGCAYDKYNEPLPDEMLEICKSSNAVLLGAVGGHKWDNIPDDLKPEKGLLKLRKSLDCFCNLRPGAVYKELKNSSPLKSYILDKGVDILIVRELAGGIYFGKSEIREENSLRYAYDIESYNEKEIRRIAVKAFEFAKLRRKKVTLVDKSNVLDSSKLFRAVTKEVSKDFPEVSLDYMYVDNCAMQLVLKPFQFDVILSNNIFGDILSDELAAITGSIGLLPSASIGSGGVGIYEPVHGSAPDIAGKNMANPIATVLSAAMMLRYSFKMEKEAEAIERAVKKVLEEGYRTADIAVYGEKISSCSEMGDEIVKRINK